MTQTAEKPYLLQRFRQTVGIPRCNQGRPPEKQKKGQFSPFLLQRCRLNTSIVF